MCRRVQGEFSIQIQEDFQGSSLAQIARLGLDVYALIPDYRDRCPLCSGKGCAVRHGLYRRRVVDRRGCVFEDFPIPRFKCRGKGPVRSRAITFSVLPAELLPRRKVSLPLVASILSVLARLGSVTRSLDRLVEVDEISPTAWLPEPVGIYRLVKLAGQAEIRLRSGPWRPPPSEIESSLADDRALALGLFRRLRAPARAAPLALEFHRLHFPRLLFAGAVGSP